MNKKSGKLLPRNLAKISFGYRLLYGTAHLFFRLYYRKFIVMNAHLVPRDEQVIFASNHQNALMDALAMLFAARRPVAFLARADMFKKTITARVLHFLKILPVFRPRDGIQNMNANYEVFQETARLLKAGMPVALLPEGTHSPIKRLQPLKKGVCRIAFQAAEAQNFEADIFIIPTGIDYTSYSKAGTSLLLIYGNPLNVAEYYPLYRENPQKAIHDLIQHLTLEIKKLMIHVEDDDFYDTIQTIINISASDEGRYANFKRSRHIIKQLHESPDKEHKMKILAQITGEYKKILEDGNFRDFNVRHPDTCFSLIVKFLLALLASPLYITGMLINYLPYKIPTLFSSKVKDKQFVSSVNYGLGLVCFILWYLISAIILIVCLKSVLALLLLPVAAALGLFSFYYFIELKKMMGGYHFLHLRRRQPDQYRQLIQIRDTINKLLPTKKI